MQLRITSQYNRHKWSNNNFLKKKNILKKFYYYMYLIMHIKRSPAINSPNYKKNLSLLKFLSSALPNVKNMKYLIISEPI